MQRVIALGVLLLALCLVEAQWAQAAPVASLAACPNGCSNRGECVKGLCECQAGFSGADCSVTCPNLCSNRGVCSAKGKCMCKPGFGGKDCSKPRKCPRSLTDHPDLECSGHGLCDRPSGTCVCKQGYVGADCSIDDGSCGSQHCSNHGACANGVCTCDIGFSGEHCETAPACPAGCSGKGRCINGQCQCYPGFSGAACATANTVQCPGKNGGCSGNGACDQGKCVCSVGFSGDACQTQAPDSQPFCAGGNTCSAHGTCHNNRCFCEPGFYGRRCQKSGCKGGCGKHGECALGTCRCEPGYTGSNCKTKKKCPNKCSGHGVCEKGKCRCQPYYTGKDCSKLTLSPLSCPKNMPTGVLKGRAKECSGQGVCFLGQCFCEPSFSGVDCSEVKSNCPNNCSGASKGTCRFGACFCEAGWGGADCSTRKKCPAGCTKRGVCVKGECKCALGYSGAACEKKLGAVERQEALESDILSSVVSLGSRQTCGTGTACSAHGVCQGGLCVCQAGWSGPTCEMELHGSSSQVCAAGCENGAECAFGKCVCLPGFTGSRCERATFLPCPGDCTQHGLCHLGACLCHPGFEGPDCSKVKECAQGCEHGACVQGVCECVWGWIGTSCNTPLSGAKEKDYLSASGLETCGTQGCGPHGTCISNQCVCVEGYTGKRCDSPLENFVARTGATPANPAVADIFGAQTCSINCGLHGVCVGGSCSCVDGWAGEACTASVPEVAAHKLYGSTDDFFTVLTVNKKRVAPVAIAEPTKKAHSFLEAGGDSQGESEEPELQRTTAILAPNQKQLKYSPDSPETTVGADTPVVAGGPGQVAARNDAAAVDTTTYSMSMNPWLVASICFFAGVLLTISLKCLLDKRDQEKRKAKKMEELLQPAI